MQTLRSPHRALLALGLGLCAAPALAQDAREEAPVASFLFAATEAEPAPEPRSEADELRGFLEDLERAARALEVLGEDEALHRVLEVAHELHGRIERGEGEGGIDELRTRLTILREARHAWAEIEAEEEVEYLNRVLHVGELQMDGAPAEALVEAMEGVSMEVVVRLLEKASDIWTEFGHEHKARRCAHLAEYYTVRDGVEQHDEDQEHGDDHREFPEWLDQRHVRVELLSLSAQALHEAGDEEAADHMRRFAHLGRLQAEGASDEALSEASRGLDMEAAIHHLRLAAEHLEHQGKHEGAHACALLSEWYWQRDFGDEEEHEVGWDTRVIDLEERPARLEIIEFASRAHAEAGREESAHFLRRFLHYGHLQEAGAGAEDLAAAAEGLSMEAAIDGLRVAAELYAKWGNADRAHRCAALADRYAGQGQEPVADAQQWNAELEERRRIEREHAQRLEEEHRRELEHRLHEEHRHQLESEHAQRLEEEHRLHVEHEHRRALEAEHAARQKAAERKNQESLARHLEELHHRMAQLHEQMAELQQHLEHLTRKVHDR